MGHHWLSSIYADYGAVAKSICWAKGFVISIVSLVFLKRSPGLNGRLFQSECHSCPVIISESLCYTFIQSLLHQLSERHLRLYFIGLFHDKIYIFQSEPESKACRLKHFF